MTTPALTCPLIGVQLIEASAGTGKTWTLSALVARLIVQRQLEIKQVLAITFTKAAAAELRDRIRQRLVQLQHGLAQPQSNLEPDIFLDYMTGWVHAKRCQSQAIALLDNAIANFDEATITTINGFCQAELIEQALASGMPFETKLLTDIRPLVEELVQDYCRQRWQQAHPVLVSYFINHADFQPSALASFVLTVLQKGQARIIKPEIATHKMLVEQTQLLWQDFAAVWLQQRATIAQLFVEHIHLLDGKSFKLASLEKMYALLDIECQHQLQGILFHKALKEALKRFSRAHLDEKRVSKTVKANQYFPSHPFFVLAEQVWAKLEELEAYVLAVGFSFKANLVGVIKYQLLARLSAEQSQSFDMQIKRLAEALTEPDVGAVLAQQLRQKYPVALVDEFQDTDDFQYQILQHIYIQPEAQQQHCALFLVGDPKQAIYGFRGADVYTYLKAHDAIHKQQRYHLDTNQRSVSPLVNALNNLFNQQTNTFKQDKIHYQEVKTGAREHAPLIDVRESTQANLQPLRLSYWPTEKTNKEQGLAWAITNAVNEVVHLLTGANQKQVFLGERVLQAKDIVFLVRSHNEGEQCRAVLAQAGIKAAVQSKDKVFQTPEADDMARVLAAFAEPHNEAKVRAVLISRLCSATLTQLLVWQEDARQWTQQLMRFQHYHKLWQQKGFMVAWRDFLQQEQAIARISHLPQGERILTNLLHLADLLHEEYRQRSGMRQLSDWFNQQRRQTTDSEAAELRLESDENLVKITTIHQSKGLEYPIVFIPSLWQPPRTDKLTPFYHQQDEAIFNLSQQLDEQAQQQIIAEVLSEDLRLAYVALTRAVQRCYIYWCPLQTSTNDGRLSALGYWLESYLSDMPRLMQVCPDIRVMAQGMADVDYWQAPLHQQPLLAVKTAPKVGRGFRLTSFSSLQQGAKSHYQEAEVLEIKDDEGKEIIIEEPDDDVALARFNFAGKSVLAKNVGNCLHQLFELVDFRQEVSTWDSLIEQQLQNHGIITTWTPDVISWLTDVMQAPLRPDLHLKDLAPWQTLRELDFHLPLHKLQTTAFIRCLRQHGVSVADLPYQEITGFLKGSIDLVFYHQGRYFIADYKSNHLGHRFEDYQPALLHEAMYSHGYYLQAAIYALALHRWLTSRLLNYKPEHHLGGVFYLFIRGMHAQGQEGILPWQPSVALLEDLSALLEETP
ncbi:exodeoxyribonuclease V subunit beta [Agitococcus lubricus]|uniref:RecBCD enzyme subunit RecB n=1 Tax=Agitococcus lubricus TaxID=1077255 RepID=A0A2T5J391_9GAMM|nr:exodeoxyribonuclease V subunit beta [Agitococcus lubricus]PTQ90963.1 DNA helicase/exodeoxyribonuclease V beta subunit [Agitococcus lubricus]